jgi:hypothetical protein
MISRHPLKITVGYSCGYVEQYTTDRPVDLPRSWQPLLTKTKSIRAIMCASIASKTNSCWDND